MANNITEMNADDAARAGHEFALKVAVKTVPLVGLKAVVDWVAANWPPSAEDDLNPEEWARKFASAPRATKEPLSITSKLRAILSVWSEAEVDTSIAYYSAESRSLEQSALLARLGLIREARRELLFVLSIAAADRDTDASGTMRRLVDMKSGAAAYERETRMWLCRVADDTMTRIDGTTALDAPVPDCGDSA
jgi:hypothetical protein